MKVESFPTERQRRPELDGFDAALDFQPDWGSLPSSRQPPRRWKLLNKLGLARPHPFPINLVFCHFEVKTLKMSRWLSGTPHKITNKLTLRVASVKTQTPRLSPPAVSSFS